MNDSAITDTTADAEAPATSLIVHDTGIIAAFATIIHPGGTLLLSIGRRKDGDTLIVTVQPPKNENDKDLTVVPFQVSGTADDLDAQLAEAVQTYVPARDLALRDVNAAATIMKANAKQVKTNASTPKPATSVNAPKPAKLVVSITPPDADVTIMATDRTGKAHAIISDVSTELPPGRCSVKITGEGFDDVSRDVTLAGDKTETVTVTLVEKNQLALI